MKLRFNDVSARPLAATFCLLPAALLAQTDSAPEGGEPQRIAAVRKLADDAYRARDVETGNQRLRELSEAYPGRWDVARPALAAILQASSRDGPDEWQEYAAVRLIAAYRAGRILRTDPILREAWGALVTLRGFQERFLEAQAEIDALADATGRDVWVDFLEAVLSYRSDSYEMAPRFAEIVSRISADDNDPYVRSVWQGIYSPESGGYSRKFLESATTYRPEQRLPSSAPRSLYVKDFAPNWQAVRDLPPEAAPSQIHAMIGDSLEQGRFIADDNAATVTWLWNLVDRHLLASKPEARLPLRQLQQSQLPRTRTTRPIELFRRYPWTDEGQQQLLGSARQELAEGRAGVALRSFREVLSHTANPAIHSEAQVGIWLALAQQDNRGDFDAAFQGVDPEARYPWMGGTETARGIRGRLRESISSAGTERAPVRLGALDRRLVRIPALAPWPMSLQQSGDPSMFGDDRMKALPFSRVGMQLHNGGLLVSAPNMLAWYRADDPATPVWQRTLRFTVSKFRRHPGVFRPPVIGNRIYTRWGYDGCPVDVAAVDTRTGRQLWSSAQDRAWRAQAAPFRGERTLPLNDPVYADGRLYLLAVRPEDSKDQPNNPQCLPLYLLCMDPNTGSGIWRSLIANEALKGRADVQPENELYDLAIYGNAVTPHQGAVYCDTSAGIVARVDARDGRLEWAHRYGRTRYEQKDRPGSRSRQGSDRISWGARPLVAGNRILCMPRDHNGVFALDADTGRLLWQNALVHPAGAVGMFEGALLVYERRTVVALDLATGATRWFRPLEEDVFGDVALIGSSVCIGTAGALYRLDARSGVAVERMAWNEKGRHVLDFAILDNTLYVVSDEPTAGGGFAPVAPLKSPTAGASDPLRLPLRRAWKLTRANSQLYEPAPEAGLDGRVFLLSDGVLECIRLDGAPSVVWQRLVLPDLAGVRLARGMVVLDYPSRPVFLDGKTGAIQEPRYASDAPGLNDLPPLYRVTANGNRMEVVNNATGERLWRRSIAQLEGGAARQAGRELHSIGPRKRGDPLDTLDVVCNLANGETLAMFSVFSPSNGVPVRSALSRTSYFFLAAAGRDQPPYVLHRYALDGKPARPVPECPAFTFGGISSMSVFAEDGPYVALQIRGSVEGVRDHPAAVVVLKEDDPSYAFVTGCTGRREEAGAMPGFMRGDRYYDALPEKGVARISDLERRQTLVNCPIPSWGGNSRYGRILEMFPVGDSLLVLWSRGELHVEMFDALSGAHKASQVLDGVDYSTWPSREREGGGMAGLGAWDNEMAEGPGMLLVTDRSGLHVLVPAERVEAPTVRTPFTKLYRRREPIVLDGSTNEWGRDEHAERTVRDADGRPASLLLAQDGWRIFAALSYEDARINTLRGDGAYCEGDWLTVEQGAGTSAGSVRLGMEPGGACVRKPDPEGRGRTVSAWAGIGYDIKTGRHVYEVVMPQAEVSLKVFDERGPAGSAKVVECDRIRVACHPLSREEEASVFALIRDLPDLPETRRLYTRLQRFYGAWSLPLPAYAPAAGAVDSAKAVESLRAYLSTIGENSFPYGFYQLMRRFGGEEALSPAVRAWYRRKEKIESARQGPFQLSDGMGVTNWLMCGYFPYSPNSGGMGIDFLQAAGGEERHVPGDDVQIASGTGAKARWTPVASPTDNVDIFEMKHLGLDLEAEESYFAVYAACWLKADQDAECELRAATGDENDSVRIYLDHEHLGDYSLFHGGPNDPPDPKVRLAKGMHLVLLKITGTKLRPAGYRPGLYTFSLRVSDLSGGRPEGLTVWN